MLTQRNVIACAHVHVRVHVTNCLSIWKLWTNYMYMYMQKVGCSYSVLLPFSSIANNNTAYSVFNFSKSRILLCCSLPVQQWISKPLFPHIVIGIGNLHFNFVKYQWCKHNCIRIPCDLHVVYVNLNAIIHLLLSVYKMIGIEYHGQRWPTCTSNLKCYVYVSDIHSHTHVMLIHVPNESNHNNINNCIQIFYFTKTKCYMYMWKFIRFPVKHIMPLCQNMCNETLLLTLLLPVLWLWLSVTTTFFLPHYMYK